MPDSMRKPFLVIALIAIFLAVLVELGSMAVLGPVIPAANTTASSAAAAFGVALPPANPAASSAAAAALGVSPKGKGIPALAFLDGLVLFATLLMSVELLIPDRVQSKVQGIITVVFSFLLLLACFFTAIADFELLIMMVSLLMALPFGTIAYFAIWGYFDTAGAHIALSLIVTLKLIFALCLVLAHQGFLKLKGFVLIILTSLLSTLIVVFLQGLVPTPLVSITDDIAAIIVCILAILWAIVYLIGGITSVIKVIKGSVATTFGSTGARQDTPVALNRECTG